MRAAMLRVLSVGRVGLTYRRPWINELVTPCSTYELRHVLIHAPPEYDIDIGGARNPRRDCSGENKVRARANPKVSQRLHGWRMLLLYTSLWWRLV
jgi:hypothetical protein